MTKRTLMKSLLAGLAAAFVLSACQSAPMSSQQNYRQEQSEAGSGPR